MDPNELRLRNVLLDIGNKLSNNDRATLGFLLANDVPRRDLEIIAQDSRASMSVVWDTLLNRQKITPENVTYLVTVLESIKRMDLARQLKQYAATINPAQLFNEIPPANP